MLTNIIDDLSQKLSEGLPEDMQGMRADMKKYFHAVLQSQFEKLNIVTREEFDVQKKVLARTREKLEALEKQLADKDI
ncbi:MAG: accessory factor UbiK family protein [Gammaproteobacteria bacterium]